MLTCVSIPIFFSKDPIDAVCKQICLSSIDKFLSPPQRGTCEGLVSLPELTNSLRSLNLIGPLVQMVSPLSSICTFGIPWVPCYYVLLRNVFYMVNWPNR